MASSLLRVIPKILPKLDPEFRPPALGHRNFAKAARASGKAVPLIIALQQGKGSISRYDTVCFPSGHEHAKENLEYAERLVKFLLWQRGGSKVLLAAPKEVVAHVKAAYSPGGARAFDADFFAKVYEAKKFVVQGLDKAKMPKAKDLSKPVGRHLNGCRIGFDAGGSDRKVAAVVNGKEVFTTETVWEPKTHADWCYHFEGIDESIAQAARHMPRIDAIGVSSAGIYVDNRVMVASLFRKVQNENPVDFEEHIKGIYLDIAKKWGNVPIEVANDGDVTALAGAMSLNDNAVLGLAMGTSQAAGYVDARGHITGWLNELAFAPVDYASQAPVDKEWSGDLGTGVNYFSQDAVIRLAPKLGIEFSPKDQPGAKLKHVQTLLKNGDRRMEAIFETIGVWLGYALLQYAEFYRLRHVLILGRVTSGRGGELILKEARRVLVAEDPVLARQISVNLPDEASRRVGQAIAAASLPEIKKKLLFKPKKTKAKPKAKPEARAKASSGPKARRA